MCIRDSVRVDVGYGGAFMVFADIGQFGIELEKKNIQVMLDIAMECGRCAIDQLEMVHPDLSLIHIWNCPVQ